MQNPSNITLHKLYSYLAKQKQYNLNLSKIQNIKEKCHLTTISENFAQAILRTYPPPSQIPALLTSKMKKLGQISQTNQSEVFGFPRCLMMHSPYHPASSSYSDCISVFYSNQRG